MTRKPQPRSGETRGLRLEWRVTSGEWRVASIGALGSLGVTMCTLERANWIHAAIAAAHDHLGHSLLPPGDSLRLDLDSDSPLSLLASRLSPLFSIPVLAWSGPARYKGDSWHIKCFSDRVVGLSSSI